MVPVDEKQTDQPVTMTAGQAYEMAFKAALNALVAAGMLTKANYAKALIKGSVAGIELTTANTLARPTPKLEKTETAPDATVQPVAQPVAQQPVAQKPVAAPAKASPPRQPPLTVTKWQEQIDRLPIHDADAFQRHYLILRDDLPGLSSALRQELFGELYKKAYDAWVDYDQANGGRFLPSPEYKPDND